MTHPILQRLDALEAALASRGDPQSWPQMSRWWRATFTRFYSSGRRQLVVRAGRRAGKSSSVVRVLVLEALYGEHRIPAGDVGIVGIVSVSRDEAAARLRLVRALLDLLGVRYAERGDSIELTSRPVVFRVMTASMSGVVGGTAIAWLCDEVALWRDAETGANPAAEVLASLTPTIATQPHARIFLVSAPMGDDDAHARAFDDGETSFQEVAYAPTWVANPTVTEADTHSLAPDDRIWRRAYLAEPQASRLACFDPDAIDRAFRPRGTADHLGRPIVVIDPSSGRKDAWTWCVVRQAQIGPASWLRFDRVDGLSGSFWSTVSASDLVDRVAAIAADVGAREVHADQREAFALASAFQARRLGYVVHTWTATSKTTSVERVRRWFADGSVELPEHERLRRELLRFEERITPSGGLTFAGRGSGHDDFVSLLLTAAMAEQEDAIASARASTRPIPQPQGDLRWAPDVWGNGGGRGY